MKPRSNTLIRRIIYSLVAMAIIASCSSSTNNESGSSSTNGSGSEPAPGTPVSGGTFTLGAYLETTGFDPVEMRASGIGGAIHMNAIYDSLMRIVDGEVEPYLAESLTSDSTLTEWTLKLRDGIEFHDGTELDAAAVIFNLERHTAPDSKSTMAPYLAVVDDMEEVDPLTVKFTLSQPDSSFPLLFTRQAGYIASPAAVEKYGEEYNLHPVGAGPFVFESWTPNDRFVAKKNANYWQADQGLPYLDEVVIRPISDATARLAALKAGDVDLVNSQLQVDKAALEDNSQFEVVDIELDGGEYFAFNLERIPDLAARRAIAMMIDPEAINNAVYSGTAATADSFFAKSSPYYTQSADWPTYNPEEGKAAVEAAGMKGKTLTYVSAAGPDRQAEAELVQANLKEAGIDVKLELLEPSDAVARIREGNFDILMGGMAIQLPLLDLERFVGTKGGSNYSGWSSEAADAAFKDARATTDVKEQAEEFKTIQDQIIKDLPTWIVVRRDALVLHATRVHVETGYYGDGSFYFDRLWVD